MQSYEGGKRDKILLKAMVIDQSHPISPRHPHNVIREHPIKKKSLSLEQYYFRYQDFLILQAFLVSHKATMAQLKPKSAHLSKVPISNLMGHKEQDSRVGLRTQVGQNVNLVNFLRPDKINCFLL